MSKKNYIFERSQGESFYPNPGSLGYVYLKTLESEESEQAKELASWAASMVPWIASSFSSQQLMSDAYSNLKNLIQIERNAENEFLSTHLKLNLSEVQTYGIKQLIDSFNKILNLETTYQTNINRVKSINEKGNGYIDRIGTIVNYELPDIISKWLEGILTNQEKFEGLMSGSYDEEIKVKVAEILTKKIQDIYKEGTEADKNYEEFAKMMRNLSSTDPLIENIMQNYGLFPKM